MRPEEVKKLLESMRSGTTTVEDALRALRQPPVENLGFARLDTHRELRQGLPEAILGESKTPEEAVALAERLLDTTTSPVLVTRAPPATVDLLLEAFPSADHYERARLVVLRARQSADLGTVAIVSAGTSDAPVAEEAAATVGAFGAGVDVIADVGVAGVHRLLAVHERLEAAAVVIVVAGMEGALPSLVGGLVAAPVIAVPTSVGYGASFEGLAALLGMLNSCAAGLTVTNIDNGFGAGIAALRILRRIKGLP